MFYMYNITPLCSFFNKILLLFLSGILVCERAHYVGKAGLSLLNAGITSVHCHTWLGILFYSSSGNKERELFAKVKVIVAKSCLGRVEDHHSVLCGHL